MTQTVTIVKDAATSPPRTEGDIRRIFAEVRKYFDEEHIKLPRIGGGGEGSLESGARPTDFRLRLGDEHSRYSLEKDVLKVFWSGGKIAPLVEQFASRALSEEQKNPNPSTSLEARTAMLLAQKSGISAIRDVSAFLPKRTQADTTDELGR